MIPGWRGLAMLAGAAGFSAVTMAAMGAHLDGGIDHFETWRSWQSASVFHLLHAVALLGLAALSRSVEHRAVGLAGLMMSAGIVLFSGSIYVSILREAGGTAGLAPIGGLCLMAAWLTLAFAAWRTRGAAA